MQGNRSIVELAQNYPTPTYLFDLQEFSFRAETIATAMAEEFWEGYGFKGASVYYAGKAFLCTALGEFINRAGLGIDTASLGELTCALNPTMGVPAEKIGLHGNNKDPRAIRLALEAGIGRIIVDSLYEISLVDQIAQELGKVAPVMVRITSGVHAGGHSFIATAHEDQKFGLSLASGAALEAVKAIQEAKNLNLIGIHSHIGSQICELESFVVATERVMEFKAEIEKLGVNISEVDLGGGLAISYTGEEVPSPKAYAQVLAKAVKESCEKVGTEIPHVSIEPGRWLAGPSCVTVYKVGTIKDVTLEEGIVRRYVSVDGGMSDNLRPVLYGAKYVATVANREMLSTEDGKTTNASIQNGIDNLAQVNADPLQKSDKLRECRVVGGHCESGDILLPAIMLPEDLRAGDLLAVPATGAYGRSMASNYNWFTRPGVLGLYPDGTTRWIYAPETVADLLKADCLAVQEH